ncbi:MAG: GNAT family N-acetyltransferase [Hyphomicrobium sp.]|uniref:GNAT family N-acetyltransferase n=1 Tax=Hyphomicrobium sp. TaxID=82 RepID=UPI0039E66E43
MLQLVERRSAEIRPTKLGAEVIERFIVDTCESRPELSEACVAMENEVWGELEFLDYTAAHHDHYEELLERHPECHLCMTDAETGELVATGMCVPINLANDIALPREGWDWIVDTASVQKGHFANFIGALSISVPEAHRHRGLARDLVKAMRVVAGLHGCTGVVAPVRPSEKKNHPFVDMKQYVSWRDDRGRIFDPWLRSHVAAGGVLRSVCDRSMVVEQPIEFWKDWAAGESLDRRGMITLKGGLAPLFVDPGKGIGSYIEPNVWVWHAV